MTIETVNLPELNWPPGTLARVWFCQPALSLSAQPPYIPVAPASTLALFEAVLALDAALGQPEAGAPSIIIMPELALAPTDVLRVLELMATARANTLLVAGVGQMTQAQVDTIEPDRATLFEASAQNLYANCALIVCAGAARAYLQPKIVPSADEHGHLWPGRGREFLRASTSWAVSAPRGTDLNLWSLGWRALLSVRRSPPCRLRQKLFRSATRRSIPTDISTK